MRRTILVSWPPSSKPTNPGGAPNSRETVCFSPNSDMSSGDQCALRRRTGTPRGPWRARSSRRRGAGEDERAGGTVRVLQAGTVAAGSSWRGPRLASSCPMTRSCRGLLHEERTRGLLFRVSLKTGMPVACARTSAMMPSSTVPDAATSPARHCFSRRRRSPRSFFSRREGSQAFSTHAPRSRLPSTSGRRDFSSNSRSSGGDEQDRHGGDVHRPRRSVDGLVRQEAVLHVAVRQVRRGDDRTVGDGHLVERLVLVAEGPCGC